MKPHYDLERIRAINLFDVVQHLQLEYNRSKKMCCPMHNEKTPSLQLHSTHFNCFGCGAKGDVIGFVEQYHGMEFQEAIAWLAHAFNIQPSEREGLEPHKRAPRVAERPPKPLSLIEKDVQLEVCQNLAAVLDVRSDGLCKDPAVHPLIPYAVERGWRSEILIDLAEEWTLGVKANGLVFCYGYGTKWRKDLRDSRSCRWMVGKARDCIWRSNVLSPAIDDIYIFEGETDLIAAASCCLKLDGFIAAPGASWRPTIKQLNEIGRGRNLFLCFDNDAAGHAATEAVGEMFDGVRGCVVSIFDWDQFPDADDIGGLATILGKDSFKKAFDSNWTAL